MKVVVTGATGNIGTSVVRALADDPAITDIVAIARRRPQNFYVPKTTWAEADIGRASLRPLFHGAAAVAHVAWHILAANDARAAYQTNVHGTERVAEAAASAGVPVLVHLSSAAAYRPARKPTPVDETWPTDGIPTSLYAMHKAIVERFLDGFEHAHPELRIVRLRPPVVVKDDIGAEVRRMILGPFVPLKLFDPSLRKPVPDDVALSMQVVHSDDVAEAVRLAIHRPVRGAFNLAADPVLDPHRLAAAIGGRLVRVPAWLARPILAASWRLHLQPADPGWWDMLLQVPIIDAARARTELGWAPRHRADDTLRSFVRALANERAADTPKLARRRPLPTRATE